MNSRTQGSPVAPIAVVVALTVFPLVGVAVALGTPGLRWVQDVAGWIGSVTGFVGAVYAALAFSRGDHLRRVWTVFAIGAGLLVLGTAIRSYWSHSGVSPLESAWSAPRAVIVSVANGFNVAALLLLVVTYRRSGLQPEPSWRANVLWVLGAAAALAIAAPQIVTDVKRLDDGFGPMMAAITSIASTLGDFTTVLLIAPILRVAYMLRGGRLAWPWWAMAIAGSLWLVFDAREWIADLLPGARGNNMQFLLVLRSPCLALLGVAGWLQRLAIVPVRTQSSEVSAASSKAA